MSRSRERRNLSSTHGRTLCHAFIRLSIGIRKGIFTTTVLHTATTLQGGRARLGRPVADTPTRLTTPYSLCLNKKNHHTRLLDFDSRGCRHRTEHSPFRRTSLGERDGLACEHRQQKRDLVCHRHPLIGEGSPPFSNHRRPHITGRATRWIFNSKHGFENYGRTTNKTGNLHPRQGGRLGTAPLLLTTFITRYNFHFHFFIGFSPQDPCS